MGQFAFAQVVGILLDSPQGDTTCSASERLPSSILDHQSLFDLSILAVLAKCD